MTPPLSKIFITCFIIKKLIEYANILLCLGWFMFYLFVIEMNNVKRNSLQQKKYQIYVTELIMYRKVFYHIEFKIGNLQIICYILKKEQWRNSYFHQDSYHFNYKFTHFKRCHLSYTISTVQNFPSKWRHWGCRVPKYGESS